MTVQFPRLIATDLDGTLLGADGAVSRRTAEALGRARDAGVEVVAATGRSRHTALPKLADVEHIRWVICSNGAMVWDRATDRMHHHRPIAGRTAIGVIAGLRDCVPEIAVGWETLEGFGFDARFAMRPPSIDEFGLAFDVPEPTDGCDITKLLLALHATPDPAGLSAALLPHIPATVTAVSSGGAFLETTAAGVDKASTLAALTAELGIAAGEVIAFGDAPNDLAMLRWAGTGVAMGNAHDEVAGAADAVAASNADDGVAAFLEAIGF